MPQSVQTTDGRIIQPGSYAKFTAEKTLAGNRVQGVLVIVGEATKGPKFSEESRLKDNTFGPDARADLVARYGSGPVVDAFDAAVQASNDDAVKGSIGRAIVVKTNGGTPGTATLTSGGGAATYSTIKSALAGVEGNLLSIAVSDLTSAAEPTTGAFHVLPPQVSTDVAFRANGGAVATATIAAATLPSATQAAINALTGVACTGGTNRAIITAVAGTLTLTVTSGYQAHWDISATTFAALPTVGDLLYVPASSPFAVAAEGSWIVTAASGLRIDAYKLLDATGAGTARTTPVNATFAIAATTDLMAFAPLVATNEAATIASGKTMEVANSGAANFSDVAYTFAGATANPPAVAATFVATSTTPAIILPTSERTVQIDVIDAATTRDEAVGPIGGDVAMIIGYKGTTASCVVAISSTAATMTITVVGGAGASQTLNLRNYPTIAALCSYLGSQAGYTAAPGTSFYGTLSPLKLDTGTFSIASSQGGAPGRLKVDAYDYAQEMLTDAALAATYGTLPSTGLPDVMATTFMSGGSRGGTTNADLQAAFEALQELDYNACVPCFSRDASEDIALGYTDSSSTYTWSAMAGYARARTLAQGTLKVGRPCWTLLGHNGTFLSDKIVAGQMNSSVVGVLFNDSLDQGLWHPAWYTAAKAAGFQLAANYRAIFSKAMAVDGASHPGGGYNQDLLSNREDAIMAGLMVLGQPTALNGGYGIVASTMTYQGDNTIYSSLDAMHRSQMVCRALAAGTDPAFTGVNISDMPASLARTVVEAILNDQVQLKWIGISDEAPKGYQNLIVKKSGVTTRINVEIFSNTANAFTIIDVLVREPSQSA